MEKLEIKSRSGPRIVVVLDKSPRQKGLAIVMHGLGGFKEQSHIQTFADAFKENEFTVITFDARHTFGESEGKYEDATTTNYLQDLEDVINWAKSQDFYEKPYLVGHSLGGFSIALYAEKNPKDVIALALISTVVSGKLSLESPKIKENLQEWNRTGWKISASASKPGLIKKLKWHQFNDDKLKYDLLQNADKLEMPVLLIVGEKDQTTPVEHQQILFDALPGKIELNIIEGAPHTFRDEDHLREIKDILLKWIYSTQNEMIEQK